MMAKPSLRIGRLEGTETLRQQALEDKNAWGSELLHTGKLPLRAFRSHLLLKGPFAQQGPPAGKLLIFLFWIVAQPRCTMGAC